MVIVYAYFSYLNFNFYRMEKSSQELLSTARKYLVYGGVNGDIATRFEGKIMKLSDGKVVCVVRDCMENDVRKLVLGIDNKETGFVSFWKMAHFEEGICPEIYNCESFPNGGHVGRYDMYLDLQRYFEMTQDIPEIEIALNTEEDDEAISILAGANIATIKEYLDVFTVSNLNIHGKVSTFILKEI